MPCGSNDSRRGGHRCVRCRMAHLKCDGHRPCLPCSQRGFACYSPRSLSTMIFVSSHPKPAVISPSLNSPSGPWIFSDVFFNAIRYSFSPLICIFSFDSIGTIFQENKLVQDVVFLVGKTYLLHISYRRTYDLRESLHRLQYQVLQELDISNTKRFTAALLSACLLSLVELIIDESAKGWRSLTRKIRAFILFHAGLTETQPHLRSSVYWFARISNAARAICFGENLPLPLSSMTCVKSETLRYPTSQNSISARGEGNIELLAIYLEPWARVQSWSIYWVKKSEELYSKDNCSKTHSSSCPALGKTHGKLPSEHITLGIEIICSASRLQRAIITTILSYVDAPVSGIQPAILSLLPYYQWSLAGLSRQFDHPAWSSLGCSLPMMHNDLIHQQAIQALEFAEESLRSTDFEALLYIPIMNVVGFEMQTEQERTRVLEFVATLKTKGFAVAGKVERDLKTAWVGKVQ